MLTSHFTSLFLCISSNSYKSSHIKTGNPLQSWILDSTLSIPDSMYWIPEFVIGLKIQDFNRECDSGFLELHSEAKKKKISKITFR